MSRRFVCLPPPNQAVSSMHTIPPIPADGEEHVLLVEKWESRDAQQAHLKMEAFRRLQSFSGDYVLRSALEAFTTQD